MSYRVIALILLASAASPAQATVRFWASPLCPSLLFSSGSCWYGGIAPGPADVAAFNLGNVGPYTVAFTSSVTNQRGWVLPDDVTWDLNGFTYNLTTSTTLDSPSLAIGRASGDNGHLTLTDGTLNSVYTGIGILAGSTGVFTVDAGATWNESQRITAGYQGTGTLDVRNGAQVSTQYLYLGDQAGASGTATVGGTGTQFVSSYSDFVGLYGDGALTVRDGARFYSPSITLGYAAGSQGSMLVEGQGTSIPNGPSITVGAGGNGSLTLRDGATIVLSHTGYIGSGATGTGAVSVTGSGSRWTIFSNLYVGDAGQGRLDISNGGTVSGGTGIIADEIGSLGAVTVDGNGSLWSGYSTVVGSGGTGSLAVTSGASVTTYNVGVVGESVGAIGTASVDGFGSSWSITYDLIVGGSSGTGTLEVTNGATIASGRSGWIGISGGNGHVTVTGPGSQWTNGEDIEVGGTLGSSGTGRLDITDSALVTDRNGFVARPAGAVGEVSVDGAGSKWTHADSLYLAGSATSAGGSATLAVSSGAAVTAGNAVKVWQGGTVRLDDGTIGAATVELAGGRLTGNGLVEANLANNGGLVDPGFGVGSLQVTGNFQQDALGTLVAQLAGTDPLGGYDVLGIEGEAALEGTLRVELLDGFAPALGDHFDLLFAAVLHGQFSTLVAPDLGTDLQWQMTQLLDATGPDVLRLEVTTVPVPGAFWLLSGALAVMAGLRGPARAARS